MQDDRRNRHNDQNQSHFNHNEDRGENDERRNCENRKSAKICREKGTTQKDRIEEAKEEEIIRQPQKIQKKDKRFFYIIY